MLRVHCRERCASWAIFYPDDIGRRGLCIGICPWKCGLLRRDVYKRQMQGSAGTISSSGSQVVYQQPDVLSQAFPASPVPTFDAPMEPFYEHLPLLEGLALVWVMGSICFLLTHIGFYLFHIRFLKKSAESGLGPEQSILLEQVRKDMHIRRDEIAPGS